MKANALMTRNVVCIEGDSSLDAAYELMTEWQIRHLPVTSEGILIGILSDRDVLVQSKVGANQLNVPSVLVEDAMTPNPITCSPTSTVAEIGRLMIEHKIDCIPVTTNSDEIVGLVTSTDLISLLIERERFLSLESLPIRYKVHYVPRSAAGS